MHTSGRIRGTSLEVCDGFGYRDSIEHQTVPTTRRPSGIPLPTCLTTMVPTSIRTGQNVIYDQLCLTCVVGIIESGLLKPPGAMVAGARIRGMPRKRLDLSLLL